MLITVASMLVLGGATIHSFLLVILIGIIAGTYSSIGIAAQLLVSWEDGEFDRLAERRSVYEQISSQSKVFLAVACSSHFMLWEKQHRVLHEASLEWLSKGTLQGVQRGEFAVDYEGRYSRK